VNPMSPQEETKVYIANAFSLQMLETDAVIRFKKVPIETVKQLLTNNNYISAIGHEATAKYLSELLSIPISTNRISIKLKPGTILIVFQLKGGRISGELTYELIKNMPYEFWLVEVLA